MAIHDVYNSWGRTRAPKNLTGVQGGAVTLEATDGSVATLLGITATTAGYATENQRYLHVLTEDNHGASPGTISVYGYSHAFLRWFELPQSHVPIGTNAAPTAVTIVAPADSGHADAALLTPDEREYRTYEILGVDRVAFVASTAGTDCYAACSTF
jgi:hypothetical protein